MLREKGGEGTSKPNASDMNGKVQSGWEAAEAEREGEERMARWGERQRDEEGYRVLCTRC